MDILLLITIFLTLLHFIYESIISPSIRLNIRHKLFILRDEIHDIKMEDNISQNDEKTAAFIEKSINNALDRMNALNIYNIYSANKEYRHNSKLREELKNVLERINNLEDNRLKEIDENLNLLCKNILLANSGGWLIYLIPLTLVIFLVAELGSKIKKTIKEMLQELLFIPNNKLEKIDYLYRQHQN